MSGLKTLEVATANRPGRGTAEIVLYGKGFGPESLSHLGRLGDTGCESTSWMSVSAVSCKLTTKIGTTLQGWLTVGKTSAVAMTSQAYSFDGGSMSIVMEQNRAGTGSMSISLHGANFAMLGVGLTSMARAGHTGCEGTEWVSETSLYSLVGLIDANTRRVVMTVAH